MTDVGPVDESKTIVSINITPLVDIMLVLLVSFVATSVSLAEMRVPLDLPMSSTGEAENTGFSVQVLAGGEYVVDGKELDKESLERLLVSRSRDEDIKRATIAADGSVSHRRVFAVLELLRRAGITQIGFAVERAEHQ